MFKYITGSSNTVNAPKIKKNKPKTFNTIEDELSTIPGSKVTVAPDGTVHVIKPNTQKRYSLLIIKNTKKRYDTSQTRTIFTIAANLT